MPVDWYNNVLMKIGCVILVKIGLGICQFKRNVITSRTVPRELLPPPPSSLQKSPNWVFGSTACIMFWNMCKNNFKIFFCLTKFSFQVSGKSFFDKTFSLAPISFKHRSAYVSEDYKITEIFFSIFIFLRIFWNSLWYSEKNRSKKYGQKYFKF